MSKELTLASTTFSVDSAAVAAAFFNARSSHLTWRLLLAAGAGAQFLVVEGEFVLANGESKAELLS